MVIEFEKEICQYLNIPSIPIKKWEDGKKGFKDGVAVTTLKSGVMAYAVATFDETIDDKPHIKKTFTIEPFKEIGDIFIVPNYMDGVDDVQDFDMDERSKEAAMRLAQEAEELENEGVEKEKEDIPENEWFFEEIHNIDQAKAWLRQWNNKNKIKGKLPNNEETIKLRLYTIWHDLQNKSNNIKK